MKKRSKKSNNAVTFNRLKKRITITFIVIWTICLVGFFALTWQNQKNQQLNLLEQSLLQSQIQTDNIYRRIQNLSNKLIRDPEIAAWLYSREDSSQSRQNITRTLAHYSSTNDDLISYVGAFNSYIELYLTSNGVTPLSTLGNPAGIEQFSFRPREIIPERTAANQFNTVSNRMLTFYTRVDSDPQRTNQGLIVVNVTHNIWQAPQQRMVDDSTYFLISENGIVLSSSDEERFITDLSYDPDFVPFFQSIAQTPVSGGKNPSGYANINIDSENKFLVWVRSEQTDLISLSLFSYRNLLWLTIFHFWPWALTFTFFIIITGAFTLLLIRNFNKPIQKLVQYMSPALMAKAKGQNQKLPSAEYELIQSAILIGEKSEQIANEKYLLDIIEGRELKAAEKTMLMPDLLKEGPWLILLCRFDNYIKLSQEHPSDMESYRFMIINVTQELLSDNFTCEGIITAENELAIIIKLESSQKPENISSALIQAQKYLRQYFGFSVSYAWLEPFTNIKSMNEFTSNTRKLFGLRLIKGRSLLINSDYVINNSKKIRYPVSAERHILEAINLKKTEAVEEGIDFFIKNITGGYSPRIIDYINQLTFSVFKQVDHTIELQDSDYENYVDTVRIISQCDDVANIRKLLLNFCLELMNLSETKTKDSLQQKHDQLIYDIRAYLSDNMSDPNLSLESTADSFNLSAGYLGKIFKTSTGENFSHYLINLRLNEASRLLTETSLPAYKVCERIGMTNVTYFSTLFKKHLGLSPTRYREKIFRENNIST